MALEYKLRERAKRLLREDSNVRSIMPMASRRQGRADQKLRRMYSLPPRQLAEALDSWGAQEMVSSQSEYGRRSGEAPKVDKTFFFCKPEKGNRTVPLCAASTSQWTSSAWDIGGVTPSNMGCYSPAATLDAPPRKTGLSGIPGYFETDYANMTSSAWSKSAVNQRGVTTGRPRYFNEVYENNFSAPPSPELLVQTFTSGFGRDTTRLSKLGARGAYKRPTKADRRDQPWCDEFYPRGNDDAWSVASRNPPRSETDKKLWV